MLLHTLYLQGSMQGTEDTQQFETAIRSVIGRSDDPLFEMVNPLEHETFFQQRYRNGDRTWIKMEIRP